MTKKRSSDFWLRRKCTPEKILATPMPGRPHLSKVEGQEKVILGIGRDRRVSILIELLKNSIRNAYLHTFVTFIFILIFMHPQTGLRWGVNFFRSPRSRTSPTLPELWGTLVHTVTIVSVNYGYTESVSGPHFGHSTPCRPALALMRSW